MKYFLSRVWGFTIVITMIVLTHFIAFPNHFVTIFLLFACWAFIVGFAIMEFDCIRLDSVIKYHDKAIAILRNVDFEINGDYERMVKELYHFRRKSSESWNSRIRNRAREALIRDYKDRMEF